MGVLVGTHPPCMELPEIASESVCEDKALSELFCIREAFTALNDCQVKGINKPIKSASNASKISVVRFLFLSSISTSVSQWLITPMIELISHLVLQVPCRAWTLSV